MTTTYKLYNILEDKFDVKNAKLQDKFVEDLGLDSLDEVEFIMAVESEFGIHIPDNKAEKIHTVQDTINYLKDNGHIL